MIHSLFFEILILATATAPAIPAQNKVAVDLKVLDSNCKPIPEFEAAVFTHESGISSWKKGKDGAISFRQGEPQYYHIDARSVNHIIVRARDYAPYILKLDHPKGNIERAITLSKGRETHLTLAVPDGRPIPDSLVPIVIFRNFQERAWLNFQTRNGEYKHKLDFNLTSLVKSGTGHYTFQMPFDLPEIYVFVDHPGFIRGFRAGPFGKEELVDGKLKIELPKPAELTIMVESPKESHEGLLYDICSVNVMRQSPDVENQGYMLAYVKSHKSDMRLERQFFAPGDYWILFETGTTDKALKFEWGQFNAAYYRDMKRCSLAPGQVENVVFRYTPYDENRYKGDYSADVNVCWHSGGPAAGVPYVLYYVDKNFGQIKIKEGTVADDGGVELTGLRGGKDPPNFLLEINKGKQGRYFMQLAGEEKHRVLEYNIVPLEGDIAPDVTLLDVFTGAKVKLGNYRGKVIFMEFWETGCGSCQRPLAKLCEIVSRRKKDWQDKAEVWAVSIDTKKKIVEEHVCNRSWLAVRHLWCHKEEPGWKSKGAQAYGITGVPTALLIDQRGHITWRGHPRSFNVEAKIDELLKMKKQKKD